MKPLYVPSRATGTPRLRSPTLVDLQQLLALLSVLGQCCCYPCALSSSPKVQESSPSLHSLQRDILSLGWSQEANFTLPQPPLCGVHFRRHAFPASSWESKTSPRNWACRVPTEPPLPGPEPPHSEAHPCRFSGSCPESHLSLHFTDKCCCPAKLLWALPPGQGEELRYQS